MGKWGEGASLMTGTTQPESSQHRLGHRRDSRSVHRYEPQYNMKRQCVALQDVHCCFAARRTHVQFNATS